MFLAFIGLTLHIQDGIGVIWGLSNTKLGEILTIITPKRERVPCVIINLETDFLKVIILKSDTLIKDNYFVLGTGIIISMSMGYSLLGQVLDGIGRLKTSNLKLKNTKSLFIKKLDIKAPGILARSSVNEPLQTGIRSVDSMFPIGRGQRELIIGDRQTGKTSLTLDTIINQKNYNLFINYSQLFCVYCAIGQKQSAIAHIVNYLNQSMTLPYTIILSASSADPASLQYLTPFTGSTVSEFFRDSGEHALIIQDDLSKQASAYRQISLILRRPPGREAYPGDVFYLHSRLLERAAKMSKTYGNGSLTCLPIVETQLGDVSAYIPTNVISITDGQIFLESKLFNKGIRPAINIGLSVSRVGSTAQVPLLKAVTGKIKLDLAQFREVEGFSFLGSELDGTTLLIVTRGLVLQELLKQQRFSPLPVEHNIILIFAAMQGWFDSLPVNEIEKFLLYFLSILNALEIQKLVHTYATVSSIFSISKILLNDAIQVYSVNNNLNTSTRTNSI